MPRRAWRLPMLVGSVLAHIANMHTLSRNPAAHALRMARPDRRYTYAADMTQMPIRLCLLSVCIAPVPAVRCQTMAMCE